MTIGEPSWLRPVLAGNFILLQVFKVATSHLYHTDFVPVNYLAVGYMPKLIIIEKETTLHLSHCRMFQVQDMKEACLRHLFIFAINLFASADSVSGI